jgi:hypothetical protein
MVPAKRSSGLNAVSDSDSESVTGNFQEDSEADSEVTVPVSRREASLRRSEESESESDAGSVLRT